ncbi:MAG: hypothetical protein M0R46_12350 [Candidatus Muirbacterium halophilum]|nr:hypothetical protein [Candidatus Muirbacterium halophilum]MCK9476707.1 hypothetical protein [Candidatus Muirbacterium halophilum]
MKKINLTKVKNYTTLFLRAIVFGFFVFMLFFYSEYIGLEKFFADQELPEIFDYSSGIYSENGINHFFTDINMTFLKYKKAYSISEELSTNSWYKIDDIIEREDVRENIENMISDIPSLEEFEEVRKNFAVCIHENQYKSALFDSYDFYGLRRIIEYYIQYNMVIKEDKKVLDAYEKLLVLSLTEFNYQLRSPSYGKWGVDTSLEPGYAIFYGVLANKMPIKRYLFEELSKLLDKACTLKPDYLNVFNSVRSEFIRAKKDEFEKSPIIFTLKELITKEMKGCLKIFDTAEEIYNSGNGKNMKERLEKITEEYSLLIQFDSYLRDMYYNVNEYNEKRLFATFGNKVKFKD